jgi:hypothetical protein
MPTNPRLIIDNYNFINLSINVLKKINIYSFRSGTNVHKYIYQTK